MARPDEETGTGMQSGTAGPSSKSPAGNDPFGMAAWMKDMTNGQLMQRPAAAMMAATAIGLSVTGHIASLMLGTLQGMAGSAQKAGTADEKPMAEPTQPVARAAVLADAAPATGTAAPAKVPVRAKPVRAKPVRGGPIEAKPVMTVSVKAGKPRRQKAAARVVDVQADDLKRISGIGPKLEQVLNGMGIRCYADVALWSDKDIKRFDDQLGFAGRIARDGWVEQAKALMKG